jgi:hypothetical protein
MEIELNDLNPAVPSIQVTLADNDDTGTHVATTTAPQTGKLGSKNEPKNTSLREQMIKLELGKKKESPIIVEPQV